ncbi:hypothetical protein A1356_00795 [Methylomonas koyamae]|uniref:Toprim domain-containing protein n=1 Tax=Methylomonas koyamae TaxID=702114 RepID=A0AA91I5W8_9GAMM|nr:hypothetical protein A1356_00795 [Methylomonas koyamae]
MIDQMAGVGLTGLQVSDLIADGKLKRFRPGWEPVKSKKRAWYVLHPFRLDNGDMAYSGAFGWFAGAESYEFAIDVKAIAALSRDERQRLTQAQVEHRQQAEQLRNTEAEQVRAKALKIWNGCNTHGHSVYAQRKRIATIGARFSRGNLVLPVADFDGVLHGLQFIDGDGGKRFLTGTQKRGHFCPVGDISEPFGMIGIAEGYATAVSCHMASKLPVLVAFDAGNLEPVAQAARAQYPTIEIVIFADDDVDNPQNPGRTKAFAAARAVSGRVLFPPHKERAV